MTKIKILFSALAIIISSLILNILLADYIAGALSNLPLLRNISWLRPKSPIVYTNKETVILIDGIDILKLSQTLKPKLATIFYIDNSVPNQAGTAIAWTADGYFLASARSFSVAAKAYSLVSPSGETYPIQNLVIDQHAGLAIFKVSGGQFSVSETFDAGNLFIGENLAIAGRELLSDDVNIVQSKLISHTSEGILMSSEFSGAGPVISNLETAQSGKLVFNSSAQFIGIAGENSVLSAQIIAKIFDEYVKSGSVERAKLGLNFVYLNAKNAKLMNSQRGFLVREIQKNSPVEKSGIKRGDIITKFNSIDLAQEVSPQELFINIKSGQKIPVTYVGSGGEQQTIITAE